ncbi:NnrS family protein [Pseudoalteromonas sp. SMS1]|uniref:NnrS family protein n=1 Tax=Pseudoalteromonas sp. SMS1 TaxID=2908894 RepID=UPI001F1692E6|nr:NnrS family protein [Pseudoalteromonas sp. SMS1]MCF2857030.1 NnrS family protein [Pseudoalteromonas sp. SMS1]
MSLIQLEHPLPSVHPLKPSTWPFLMLGFRPMFLLAGIWAVLSMLIWTLVLSGLMPWHLSIAPTLWHAHEMLFGFASAVAIGFLLTASQNWTGIPTLSGSRLLFLTLVWFCARLVFLFNDSSLIFLVFLQATFWLLAICHFANTLLKAKSKNNYPFIIILCAMASFNMVFLWLVKTHSYELIHVFSHLAILGFTLLISVIAGRVVPFFIARGLSLTEQVKTPRLDKWLFWSAVIGMGGFFSHHVLSSPLNPGYVLVFTAVLHLVRSAYWFTSGVLTRPLLWSLFIAYLFMALGLLGFGGSYLNFPWYAKDALHLITIGAMGLMILSIMARVSLGHTARPLIPHPLMSVAFGLCALSAVTRSILPIFINPHHSWLASALLWIAAFVIFVTVYTPILMKKRLDGRRG